MAGAGAKRSDCHKKEVDEHQSTKPLRLHESMYHLNILYTKRAKLMTLLYKNMVLWEAE